MYSIDEMGSRSSARVPSVDECREELRAILSSRVFHQAENLSRLLKYVCDKTLLGEADDLTEYTIAVDVYGKPRGFRDQRDSSVRVDVHRLRKRLALYYANVGANHTLRIVIPVGGYVPDFQLWDQSLAMEPSEEPHESELIPTICPLTNGSEPMDLPAEAIADTESAILPAPSAAEPVRSRFAMAAVAVLLVLVVAPLLWILRAHVRTASQGSFAVESYPPAPATNAEVHILAGFSGREWKDAAGRLWQPDRYFKGGVSRSVPRDLQSAPPSRRLVQTMREAGSGDPIDDGTAFSYDIPLQPGVYELHLYFADPLIKNPPQDEGEDNQNVRLFAVTANGRPLLRQFDVVSDAGNSDVDVRSFKDIAPASDGKVHLSFLTGQQRPFVNAIELVPSRPGHANPIRIAARRTSYTDPQGKSWEPDNYFIHGRIIRHATPSDFPELFRSERYGSFSYSIPVPEGSYTLTLYFAETFFDPLAPLICRGSGCRVFDVSCNGTTLLRDFDISEAGGGAFRPVVRKFTGLRPNAQGKLMISFSSSVNYAEVRAIEVVDEAP